uniref:Uncharacterized protein n=1 Tax=Arundo donax TaxID=35708 RepID=A0A0A9DH57_ARUDO
MINLGATGRRAVAPRDPATGLPCPCAADSCPRRTAAD